MADRTMQSVKEDEDEGGGGKGIDLFVIFFLFSFFCTPRRDDDDHEEGKQEVENGPVWILPQDFPLFFIFLLSFSPMQQQLSLIHI